MWWTWLDENNVGCANWSAAALGETSAAFKPGASATGPWTDDMLKPSGTLGEGLHHQQGREVSTA